MQQIYQNIQEKSEEYREIRQVRRFYSDKLSKQLSNNTESKSNHFRSSSQLGNYIQQQLQSNKNNNSNSSNKKEQQKPLKIGSLDVSSTLTKPTISRSLKLIPIIKQLEEDKNQLPKLRHSMTSFSKFDKGPSTPQVKSSKNIIFSEFQSPVKGRTEKFRKSAIELQIQQHLEKNKQILQQIIPSSNQSQQQIAKPQQLLIRSNSAQKVYCKSYNSNITNINQENVKEGLKESTEPCVSNSKSSISTNESLVMTESGASNDVDRQQEKESQKEQQQSQNEQVRNSFCQISPIFKKTRSCNSSATMDSSDKKKKRVTFWDEKIELSKLNPFSKQNNSISEFWKKWYRN